MGKIHFMLIRFNCYLLNKVLRFLMVSGDNLFPLKKRLKIIYKKNNK